MPLRSLPELLRTDELLGPAVGARVLAVPEAARAFVLAGLSGATGHHPLVVAVPTTTDAERLAHDLRAYLGPDEVDVFPAWETLPFERVSPSVETMGRRLRVMWRLRDPARMPRLLVAPVRALVQRLGPHVEDEPWGREQWERLAEGATFEGMESWLPWLTEGEHVLFHLVGRDAEVALVEPRRMRDRAAELLDEEAALAATLAQTWGATSHASKAASPDGDWPRLHLPFDRLLTHTDAPVRTIATAPEGPGTAVVTASGWDPVMGDGARLAKQLRELLADGFRVVVAADGKGSAGRLAQLLADEGVALPLVERGERLPPGGSIVVEA